MIPVNEPLLSGNEEKYVLDCIRSGWISSAGQYIERFEKEFSAYIGRRYGIAVSNGTAALETALFSLGINEGDEVIMPCFTIISCALAVLRLGAKPVLVDIESDTWNMDVNLLEEKITDNTKVIMPVHIYGHPVDMDPLLKIAEKYDLFIMEDAAEVHGAEYKGEKCGSFGDVSIFSFYANKIITTGEGGMVLTDDESIAEKARLYRNLCFVPEERFFHYELGNNYRITNLQAAVGCAQLEQIEKHIEIKRKLGKYYKKRLSEIDSIKLQVEKPWAKTVYWMYCLELDEGMGLTAKVMGKELAKRGIGSRPFFHGLHDQPVFGKMGLFSDERYPITERASRQGLYLPSGLTLTEREIDLVCDSVSQIIEEQRKE